MSARIPTHAYGDPLDQIWRTTAERIGFRVSRSDEVYAATDGKGAIVIGSDDLDADDCVAQMIFHELCHSLIEGREAFERADWGLDNSGESDLPREHACLRVQAALSAPHGLRTLFAPTTDHRAFYDALPDDPLEPRTDPSVVMAIIGLQRAESAPWAPHLGHAIAATADIARRAAEFASTNADDLPPLWRLVAPAPPRHPIGFGASPAASDDRTCGTCAWRFDAVPGESSCRHQEASHVKPAWPACERWEAPLDCNTCAACCRAAYHSVTVTADDPVVTKHRSLIVDRGGYLELRRNDDRCAALEGGPDYRCSIYPDRPRNCHDFENAGDHCLTARRRLGLSRGRT